MSSAPKLRMADTDMLGRFEALPFRGVVRCGAREVQIETNDQDFIRRFESLSPSLTPSKELRSLKVVFKAVKPGPLPKPTLLRSGEVLHVAFGTAAWLVIDERGATVTGFFRSGAGEACEAIRKLIFAEGVPGTP